MQDMLKHYDRAFEHAAKAEELEREFDKAWSEFSEAMTQTKNMMNAQYSAVEQRQTQLFVFHLVYTCVWLAWSGFKIAVKLSHWATK